MDGIEPSEKTEEETPAPAGGGQTDAPQQPESKKGESKLHGMHAVLLLGAALLVDGTQWILTALAAITVYLAPIFIALNWAISGVAWLGFFLWLHSLGVGMLKKGSVAQSLLHSPLATTSITAAVEFILGALPAWTAAMFLVVVRENAKEVVPFKKPVPAAKTA